MRRTPLLVALLVAGVSAAPSARAQGLAAAAAKEKERRAKQKASGSQKSYGDSDLGRVGAPLANDPSIAPAAGESSAASGATAAEPQAPRGSTRPPTKSLKEDEQYWRSRNQELRAAVATPEARLKNAESAAANLGPLDPQVPEYHCKVVISDREYGPKCFGQHKAAIRQATAELEAAHKARDRARQALDGLFDEVRRAGAMPGWIR